jgi:dihydrofolate reductase
MRSLTVNTFLTLDGVMQAPGGPEEDPTGGFALGGWSVSYWDDLMGEVMGNFMSKPFDIVLGRRTYEIFAAHWPNASEEQGAKVLNEATKHVASRTLKALDWANSHLIEGDVVEGIRALKQEDGPELQIHGSANLIQSLLPAQIIDEFRLWLFPLVVGRGKRLFDKGAVPAGLELVDHKVSSTGVAIATYRPAGEIQVGSFALDEPTEAELERRSKLQS